MAERRMFAKTIIDSDAFLDMPLSTQALYFHLSMRGDDDGFINNPKKIQRMIGCSDDDMRLLIAKNFLIPFESGVVVIKHWRIHNYIRVDRYKETVYQDELAALSLKPSGAYTLGDGDPVFGEKKESKPLTAAQQRRLDAKKESNLPYSFEYKIRQAFIGEPCPICGCTMSYDNELVKPTIQHNVPISLGGKHEITNISVICKSCNSSIQNRTETPPYNTDKVIEKWECIGNGVGMETQVRLGKDRIGKDSNEGEAPVVSSEKEVPPFVAFADGDEELLTALKEFKAHRMKLKKPLTPYAEKLMVSKLKKLSPDKATQIAILNQSIEKGWAGVFDLKADTPSRNGGTNDDHWDKLKRVADSVLRGQN